MRKLKVDREFALASASLRQALQDMPELTEMSKHIMFEETKQGLNLEIVDQDGRSMFPDGSKVPYDRTRRLIQKLAAPLKATPLRVSIVGHTAAGFVPSRSDYGAFDLSADRANAVRQILEREGLPASAHLRGVRQGRQPAAVSRRSLAAGQPSRDHHLDARRSAAAAGSQAVIPCKATIIPVARWCLKPLYVASSRELAVLWLRQRGAAEAPVAGGSK